MKDKLDVALASAFDEIREEFDAQQRDHLGAKAARVFERAGRRRVTKAVGASGVVAFVAFGALSVPFDLRFGFGGAPPTSAAAGGARSVVAAGAPGTSHDDLGFWPEVRAQDSIDYCEDMNMHQPEQAAVAFANDLLSWSNVAVKDYERESADRMVVTLGNLPSTYRGGSLPPNTEVKFGLRKIGGRDCWWLNTVWSPNSNSRVSATVEDGTVTAEFDLPEGVDRGDVFVVEADPSGREYVAGEPGRTSARVEDFQGPGYLLVVWKGSDGSTAWAAGVTLPEGDGTYTSP